MYILKGFAAHALLANNTPGIVSKIGEISTQSLTYAREKGTYVAADVLDINLFTFNSSKDNVAVVAASNVVEHALTIVKFVYTKILTSGGTIYADQLLSDALIAFGTIATDFKFGDIITDGNGHAAPEWISWTNTSIPEIANNLFKFWFVDNSFQRQYDEFQIVIVPPVDNLNLFFKNGSDVEAMIGALTPSDTMNRIQAGKNNYPDTVVRAETYNWVDPINLGHKLPVTWNILIYGDAGNNIDSITDVLIDYILTNSTHTRAEWTLLFPDLFKRTEFILVPLWDQYAIPNRSLEAGIYSPTANLKKIVALFKQTVSAYLPSHIENYLSLTSNPYKSLQVMAVGSIDNRNDWFQLVDVFSDYIAVSSTSIDFNRMSLLTQNWATMIAEMLIIAETANEFTSLDIGMTKTKRNGILYIVKRYNNINYLIAAKKNFPIIDVPAH